MSAPLQSMRAAARAGLRRLRLKLLGQGGVERNRDDRNLVSACRLQANRRRDRLGELLGLDVLDRLVDHDRNPDGLDLASGAGDRSLVGRHLVVRRHLGLLVAGGAAAGAARAALLERRDVCLRARDTTGRLGISPGTGKTLPGVLLAARLGLELAW